MFESEQQVILNRIHNLANDLKAGLISWSEFDAQVEAIIKKIT